MIFFDLDDTLIDRKKAEYLGVKAFYSEHSPLFAAHKDTFYESWRKISNGHFRRFLDGEISFAQQRIERMKDVFALSGIDLSDSEANRQFKIYRRHYEVNLVPYDDVVPCLEGLKGRRLGIITNGDLEEQMFKLWKINYRNFFEIVIAAGDVGAAKPDLEIFKIACERANVDARDCVYVGDDVGIDILPCMKAGMDGIWLNRKDEGQAFPGIRTIRDLAELESVLP